MEICLITIFYLQKKINFEVHLRKTHINTEMRKYQIN